MNKKIIQNKLNIVGRFVASELNHEGFWEGQLSSSALGVAVAVAALHFDDAKKNSSEF